MSKPKGVTAAVTLEFDGIKIEAWVDPPTNDVHLQIDNAETAYLSPATATILGHALLQLAKPEEA